VIRSDFFSVFIAFIR